MASNVTTRLRTLSPWAGRAGVATLLTLLVYVVQRLVRWLYPRRLPLDSVLGFVAVWAASFLIVYGVSLARKKLLWSLRNQMGAAYILIAVVPLLLLLAMAGLGAYLLYWQIGSYILYSEVQTRVQRVSNVGKALATALAIESEANGHLVSALPVATQGTLDAAKAELPGLQVEVGAGEDLLTRTRSGEGAGFAGIVFDNQTLTLEAVVVHRVPQGKLMVLVSAPVTPQFLETLAPELGPIHFLVNRPEGKTSVPGQFAMLNGEKVKLVGRVATERRPEPGPASWFDKRISGFTLLRVVDMEEGIPRDSQAELRASFVTRPSLLNRQLFGPLGDIASTAVTLLFIVGIVFLVIEFAALATGILLTRAMTTSVDDLYLATRHVQSGDLSSRVQVKKRDELGALGESFNSMVQSIGGLIEEQRQRQRLENELAIAREVQTQLLPREVPNVPGVELEAICRPARLVSGDYYDFIRIGPTRLAVVLADISGKGISAALLMASLQAALHSELLRDGLADEPVPPSTAELAAHLNRHLYLHTSEERYATLFLAIYDARNRQLSYTNAGHVAPLYLAGDRVQRLTTDDTVIGLFADVQFQQVTIDVAPEALLVIYSDGMTDPENARGEFFGTDRVAEVALRSRRSPPQAIASAILKGAEDWSGPAEQADDMTVVVARFSAATKPSTDDEVHLVEEKSRSI